MVIWNGTNPIPLILKRYALVRNSLANLDPSPKPGTEDYQHIDRIRYALGDVERRLLMGDSRLVARSNFTRLDATADNLITHVSRFQENRELSSLADLSHHIESILCYASQFPPVA